MTSTRDPLPELVETLTAGPAESRLDAVKALGRLGVLAREAVPALVVLLEDPNAELREAATQSLGQMGSAAVSALSAALTHPDKYVRRQAVWGLAKLGSAARSAIPDLCEALGDADARTCNGAVQALGALGADAEMAVPALIRCMAGHNRVLCRMAAKALSQIGPSAIPMLLDSLADVDPFVRGEAALALGWMGGAAGVAVPLLAAMLTPPDGPEPDASHRVHAAQALGRIGSAVALPALREASRDANELVRDAARQAVRLIGA